ncbi:hypothetical protein Saso_33570 [Streptomyces asoensis]|uniref:Uncharacterized protein n=1 Tax=Streptomyces asoensis TaxID=249586 RepID=A0ABQ3S0P8_9ACTN|nr:hypothetical protein GCM10010496_26920 [Streptomyces asoensis]GHI61707.1 hypothetical protein Saso_33570 [Streptomyces asoensis]
MRPFRPPFALIQRAYALAKAGMPGLLVAEVPSGAQVITTIGSSPEPPGTPGTTPQPTASDVQAVRTPAARAADLTRLGRRKDLGRKVLRVGVRRLPVMHTHDSVTSPTRE